MFSNRTGTHSSEMGLYISVTFSDILWKILEIADKSVELNITKNCQNTIGAMAIWQFFCSLLHCKKHKKLSFVTLLMTTSSWMIKTISPKLVFTGSFGHLFLVS